MGYNSYMNITLPPEQEQWLRSKVSSGEFASIDEAISFAVAHLMPADLSDLGWTLPYLDEARASLQSGEGLSLEEFQAHAAKRRSGLTS